MSAHCEWLHTSELAITSLPPGTELPDGQTVDGPGLAFGFDDLVILESTTLDGLRKALHQALAQVDALERELAATE